MATATIQCYFNKIKLFKSFTNKLYIYNCANIFSDCHSIHFHSRREISTNALSGNRLQAINLPLNPSFKCNNNRRQYCHHNHINQQLHWTIKKSLINGATITSSSRLLQKHLNITQYECKNYYGSSANNDSESKKLKRLPELMEFPKIVWPSIIKSVKNWILVNLIIRPYFDKEFDISDFSSGTRHALQVLLLLLLLNYVYFFVNKF